MYYFNYIVGEKNFNYENWISKYVGIIYSKEYRLKFKSISFRPVNFYIMVEKQVVLCIKYFI